MVKTNAGGSVLSTTSELLNSIKSLKESLRLAGYSSRRIDNLIVTTVGTEDLESLDTAKLMQLEDRLKEQYTFAQACLRLT